MGFERIPDEDLRPPVAPEPSEAFGVYVPVLLPNHRIITGLGGMIIKGQRTIIRKNDERLPTDELDAHHIAGRRGIPTKAVGRIPLDNKQSCTLNGIAYAVKPVHGHTIDLDKHGLEVHQLESLEAAHREAAQAEQPPERLAAAERQIVLLRAMASTCLRLM